MCSPDGKVILMLNGEIYNAFDLKPALAGNYLGQNYGKITKVGETEVTLREIVQDAGGEWIERTAKLQLQERAK